MKKRAPLQTLSALIDHGLLKESDSTALTKVVENFSVSITKDMANIIDSTNPNDGVAKQFIPSAAEQTVLAEESLDPIGDATHGKVKGIIHRYPDRLLLTPLYICPVYCRFCFRKEKIGSNEQTLSPQELEQAYDYIAAQPMIWEVIITGGDPFILKPASLKKIITRLNNINHVEIIRIHTRVPLVDPSRITDELISSLSGDKTVYVVLHANHPDEFTEHGIKAIAKLINSGIPMLSQTVLLKDINDNIGVLSKLMRLFVKHRIKPYYLHQADLVRGTSHFRVSIAKGQALMKELHGRFSGLCQPTYVLDIPGGFGKAPIGPQYIQTESDGFLVEDYQCQKHHYQK